jgi:predicted phosphodiesterase
MTITVIGDTHNKYDKYYKIASKCEYSIQLGDFGSESYTKLYYSNLNPNKHKICSGNHCNYDVAPNIPHYLGDFGQFTLDNRNIFFIRGGISIDRVYRVGEELNGGPKTWWSQEELNYKQMIECEALYKKLKPKIVISHAPPQRFIEKIHGNKDNSILQRFKFHDGFCENTSLLCDRLLDIHLPDVWISGHHHRDYIENYGGRTGQMKFISLGELSTYNLE